MDGTGVGLNLTKTIYYVYVQNLTRSSILYTWCLSSVKAKKKINRHNTGIHNYIEVD